MAETKKTAKKTTKKVSTAKKTVAKKTEKKDIFAVIELAGTQLKVREGKEYEVNKLSGNKGDKIEIKNVLLISDGKDVKIGKPYVKDAKVSLEITSQKKDTKVKVFKYKAKARYRRTYGHRPAITRLLVKKIS
jgi:large subunit ribosomal protein L21